MTSLAKNGKLHLLTLTTLCMVGCGDMEGEEKPEGSAAEALQQALPGGRRLTNADCANSCLKCVGALPQQGEYGYCAELNGWSAHSTSTSCVAENFFCTTQPPVVGSKGSGCTYVGCTAKTGGQYSCQQNYCFGPSSSAPRCGGPGEISCAQLCTYF